MGDTPGIDEEPGAFQQQTFAVPNGATELFLIRHGQSAAFRPGRPFALVDGQGDPPLSELGRWQAERAAERFTGEAIDAVYVTTLRRTVETAAPLVAVLDLEATVEPDLREVHLGDWEGGVFRQRAAEGHQALAELDRTQDWAAIPGAESSASLRTRVRRAVEGIHRRHRGQRVVAVSHGGAIGAVVAEATGARSLAFSANDNASITHVVVDGERWAVRRFNDTGHLAGELSRAADQPT